MTSSEETTWHARQESNCITVITGTIKTMPVQMVTLCCDSGPELI